MEEAWKVGPLFGWKEVGPYLTDGERSEFLLFVSCPTDGEKIEFLPAVSYPTDGERSEFLPAGL